MPGTEQKSASSVMNCGQSEATSNISASYASKVVELSRFTAACGHHPVGVSLRLAESLDRSRHGVIRALEVRERMGELRIKVQAVGDAELELWAAHRQARALEEALARRVRIEKVPHRRSVATALSGMESTAAVPRRRTK